MTRDGAPTGARLGVLSVAAIGVVYGDIPARLRLAVSYLNTHVA